MPAGTIQGLRNNKKFNEQTYCRRIYIIDFLSIIQYKRVCDMEQNVAHFLFFTLAQLLYVKKTDKYRHKTYKRYAERYYWGYY